MLVNKQNKNLIHNLFNHNFIQARKHLKGESAEVKNIVHDLSMFLGEFQSTGNSIIGTMVDCTVCYLIGDRVEDWNLFSDDIQKKLFQKSFKKDFQNNDEREVVNLCGK